MCVVCVCVAWGGVGSVVCGVCTKCALCRWICTYGHTCDIAVHVCMHVVYMWFWGVAHVRAGGICDVSVSVCVHLWCLHIVRVQMCAACGMCA